MNTMIYTNINVTESKAVHYEQFEQFLFIYKNRFLFIILFAQPILTTLTQQYDYNTAFHFLLIIKFTVYIIA